MAQRLLAILILGACCAAHAAEHFDGKTWWATVKVLSDDKFEGRDTGSKGEQQAQEYIVQRLQSLGVQSAGPNGYYQTVSLRTLQIDEADCQLSLVRDGQTQRLTLGEQAIISTRFAP